MKTASNQLKELLASGRFHRADLFTITLKSGHVIRWTTFDVPLQYAGHWYYPFTITRGDVTSSCGLSVDDLEVDIYYTPNDLLEDHAVLETDTTS